MTTETHLSAFIARQRELLTKERHADLERTSLLLSRCSPKLLEQRGLALGGLGVAGVNIGLGGKTLVELERPTAYHTTILFPPHTLRPGDIARIESHVATTNTAARKGKSKITSDTATTHQAEGVVYKVTDTRIVIAVDGSDSSTDDLDLPERCRVVKLANSVTYDRMDKTIDYLERAVGLAKSGDKSQSELTALTRVLLGMQPISSVTKLDNLEFFDSTLNDSQKEAVRFVLGSPEIACIHGPPGTGKTHTLIEVIRHLILPKPNESPKRLLVCGASNLSVDNILERLLALPAGVKGEKIKVTRMGHPARVMANEGVLESTLEVKATRSEQAALAKDVKNELETALSVLSGKGKGAKGKALRGAERKKMWEEVKVLRKEYRQREGGVVKGVLKESEVVVSTCHTSGSRQMQNEKFDVVIIDEATQALEAVCWIPIFKAEKLILAGDPLQLPPTILYLDEERKSKSKSKSTSSKIGGKKPTSKSAPSSKAQPQPDLVDVSDEDSDDSSDSDEPEESTAAQVADTKPSTKNKSRVPVLHSPKSLETTLFDRLEKMYGPSIKRMLTVQYRMHSDICDFPSKTLYGSKLTSHESVASHLLSDLSNASTESEEDKKEILGTPVVFFDTSGCEYFERVEGEGDEGSRCNENEALVVKNWVEKLIGVGILPSQIAVITPYQAQVTLLTSLLRPLYGVEIEIGTVDGMQGREKEAVIISLVRSNDTREVGFLKERRRMNVAMTRARRHLCIVGDSSTVCHGGKYLKKWLKWLEDNADVRYGGLD